MLEQKGSEFIGSCFCVTFSAVQRFVTRNLRHNNILGSDDQQVQHIDAHKFNTVLVN